ncbi:hypothetical protein RBSWK_06601 [Rhodopirellula baltica SWK14]|uniref:Uncharacterized protein n=1 Tax=Rhodopirellula baltica SWK14 TaxID=993516 RepID=L7C5S6_RHOBT|nr:hypothetical protein RBSWK_06601 [Rhodopirellula baltica SWK14]
MPTQKHEIHRDNRPHQPHATFEASNTAFSHFHCVFILVSPMW